MVGGIRPSAGVVLPLLPPALLHYTINRRKLQAVRQKICAKKVEMLGGVPCAAPARPAAVENSMGGLPRRCRRGGRQRYPAGGLPGWSPAYPAFTFFSAPYPPSPLPQRGRGRPRLFHARGFAPCIPATEPARHWFALPLWKTQWGACPGVAGAAGVSDTRRGACPVGRLPTLPLVYFPAPYPPSPLPQRGRGRLQVISCKGLRPLHPRG